MSNQLAWNIVGYCCLFLGYTVPDREAALYIFIVGFGAFCMAWMSRRTK